VIVREVKVFLLKNKGGNRLNCVKLTWEPSFSKIYTVSNNRRLPSGSYTVLVRVGDLVRLVFTMELFSKSSRRNSIDIRVSLAVVI
jgi:hypothetical protein